MLKEGIKTRSACRRKEDPSFIMYFLFLFLPSACSSCFYSFLQHVLLVFIPSFSMHFLFLFLPSACTSCFYSFLQHVLLVFIPSFSMHFLFLFRPTAYASCFFSFLQHALLVFIPSQEVHAEGRNKNKKYMLKEGKKTRSICRNKE
jgi:hypothetical protein